MLSGVVWCDLVWSGVAWGAFFMVWCGGHFKFVCFGKLGWREFSGDFVLAGAWWFLDKGELICLGCSGQFLEHIVGSGVARPSSWFLVVVI